MAMPSPSRREMLVATGGLVGATAIGATRATAAETSDVAADLDRYVGFGCKASGGPGDEVAGAWMEGELARSGFATERRPFTAPFFHPDCAELRIGKVRAPVIPQAIVVQTPAHGVTGPIRRVQPGVTPASTLAGAIALIDLPYDRWSSALAKPIHDTVAACFAAGASAAVLVTNGPTHAAIALNADGRQPMFAEPVAVLSPDRATPFFAAAEQGKSATLIITGQGGSRSAFNVMGRLDRGRARWIVVSTPRSGWGICAGERGGGIAAWCALARWAPRVLPGVNLAFLCTSGHEYEYLGVEHAFDGGLPSPATTALWLHLGANVAARDWQDLTGTLLPLPSADPQRYLVTSPRLVEPARRLFAGQPGLEVPRGTDSFSAGELGNVIAAGYTNVAGIFGAHRFHHVAQDDQRCLEPIATASVIASTKALLIEAAGQSPG